VEIRPFVNFTNHPSDLWGECQREQAEIYGEVVDIPFPQVFPNADEREIINLARLYAEKISKTNPAAVLCQGEYSLCFAVSNLLIDKGIIVLFACSKRQTNEKTTSEGRTQKASQYEFVRFRQYEKK